MYDMANMKKLARLGELAPDAWKAFVAFDEAVMRGGAIPLKYKELMAVAVALTTQCPYCIEIHTKKAKKAGANEQELAETTLIAAALRAGGAVTHGTHTLE
jgi:AhpD family alkylhydroperoxidase